MIEKGCFGSALLGAKNTFFRNLLVTKVLLGTFGCLPACDRYFVAGWKGIGNRFSYLNRKFVERVLTFCRSHFAQFLEEQALVKAERGVTYPLMKLLDMYFWQMGYDAEASPSATSTSPPTVSVFDDANNRGKLTATRLYWKTEENLLKVCVRNLHSAHF